MDVEKINALATWDVTCRSEYGTVIHRETRKNLIVDVGKILVLESLFTSLPATLLQNLGVGAGSVTAANSDIGLDGEITTASTPAGSLGARIVCTNTSNVALSNSDVVFDNSVSPYRYKITLQGVYATTDNNGTTFGEFGLFSANANPTQVQASNSPSAGSNVVLNVPSTTGFATTNTVIIWGNTGGGYVVENQVINAVNPGTSITVATLSNTYTSHPVVTKPSGTMFNHFVLATPISKTSAFSVTVQVTIRV